MSKVFLAEDPRVGLGQETELVTLSETHWSYAQ